MALVAIGLPAGEKSAQDIFFEKFTLFLHSTRFLSNKIQPKMPKSFEFELWSCYLSIFPLSFQVTFVVPDEVLVESVSPLPKVLEVWWRLH